MEIRPLDRSALCGTRHVELVVGHSREGFCVCRIHHQSMQLQVFSSTADNCMVNQVVSSATGRTTREGGRSCPACNRYYRNHLSVLDPLTKFLYFGVYDDVGDCALLEQSWTCNATVPYYGIVETQSTSVRCRRYYCFARVLRL